MTLDGFDPERVVGKRIRDVYVQVAPARGAAQVVLVFTDFSGCFVRSEGAAVYARTLEATDPEFNRVLKDKQFETLESAVYDPDREETERIHDLFITLWTKAGGGPDYDKKEWNELGTFLGDMGISG